jgi:hypothetical protein
MIFLPCFMKIGAGVEAVLRFCSRNFKDFNVDITG